MYDLAVIGGGATGVVASIKALSKGKTVAIFEKKDRLLKKVLVTGNGQCNFTNIYATNINYHSLEQEKIKNEIVKNVFSIYSPSKVIEFFFELGVEHIVKDRGKVYPRSLSASSVVDALRFKLESLNPSIFLNTEIKEIKKENEYFLIGNIKAKKLLITTGGISQLDFDQEKSVYFNFTKTKLKPAIVQLQTRKEDVKGLEGIKVNADVAIYSNDKQIRKDTAELLFTPYGLSGPVIFNLSVEVAKLKTSYVLIDLLKDISKKDLVDLLINRKYMLWYLEANDFLSGILPKKLGQYLLKKVGIEKLNINTLDISDEKIYDLANLIKEFKIEILQDNGFKNAQVTAGGVSLLEINNDFSHKKIQNLYLAGEILDIYGDCGGFNLQMCFASGLYIGDKI